MRRLLSSLILILILSLAASAALAQSVVSLSSLEIAFWPEFDRPAMLVIYRGTFSPDTSLPASVRIDIPAKYGPPIAVAFIDAQGQLLNLEYTTAVSGDTMSIAFSAPSANFQIEYYDSGLDLSSTTRRYSFATALAYPIDSLTLQVQQPVDASGMQGTPALGQPRTGSDGLTYFDAARSNIAAGSAITFDISYTKATDTLTSSVQGPVVTPDLPPEPGAATQGDDTILIWAIVGLVGVAMVGGGVVMYARSRAAAGEEIESPASRRAKLKGHPPKPKEVGPRVVSPEAESPQSVSFCHECGNPVQSADLFCRNCGAKVRR
ncbi:MAG: zinc ribbon domain-containing protein [Chloroflexi bacterium]|nr:zinc ribbon domain-containing protein [Chloroflexota bacterium]